MHDLVTKCVDSPPLQEYGLLFFLNSRGYSKSPTQPPSFPRLQIFGRSTRICRNGHRWWSLHSPPPQNTIFEEPDEVLPCPTVLNLGSLPHVQEPADTKLVIESLRLQKTSQVVKAKDTQRQDV